MLALFEQYEIKATWATVGMLMCRDYADWRERRPALLPNYERSGCSNYLWDDSVRENPDLFFGRPLVDKILQVAGQELATHTYSHFFCGEAGVTTEQFTSDLICAQSQAKELGFRFKSLVFPRNQVRTEFLNVLPDVGISVYRGNPGHLLYRDGHFVPGGLAGRAVRFADTWLPLTGSLVSRPFVDKGLVNVPASFFLRPWSRHFSAFERMRMFRMKRIMTEAAIEDSLCHIWWHPHNFGINTDRNLAVLEELLKHFCYLRDKYGMESRSMDDFAGVAT